MGAHASYSGPPEEAQDDQEGPNSAIRE